MTKSKTAETQIDPEIALMLRVQRDEPEAFSDLLELYWHRIFGKLLHQIGDRQEAEDLTQDVFLRVYRNRKRYRPTAKFATWIYHIARNVARNAARTKRRRPTLPLGRAFGEERLLPEETLPDLGESPTIPIEREELASIVRDAMTELGMRQREALELQFSNFTYGEIAERLDVTPKAAKSLLYRARNHLRESLESFWSEGDV
jgi:RNA polymerase sigma-70 factor (ECF subfamily)